MKNHHFVFEKSDLERARFYLFLECNRAEEIKCSIDLDLNDSIRLIFRAKNDTCVVYPHDLHPYDAHFEMMQNVHRELFDARADHEYVNPTVRSAERLLDVNRIELTMNENVAKIDTYR